MFETAQRELFSFTPHCNSTKFFPAGPDLPVWKKISLGRMKVAWEISQHIQQWILRNLQGVPFQCVFLLGNCLAIMKFFETKTWVFDAIVGFWYKTLSILALTFSPGWNIAVLCLDWFLKTLKTSKCHLSWKACLIGVQTSLNSSETCYRKA